MDHTIKLSHLHPWATKRRRPNISYNCEKIRRVTFVGRFVYLALKTLLYVGDTKKLYKNNTAFIKPFVHS